MRMFYTLIAVGTALTVLIIAWAHENMVLVAAVMFVVGYIAGKLERD